MKRDIRLHNRNRLTDGDALVEWAFDPERQMQRYLERLKDDARSDDPKVRTEAEQKIFAVLEWYLPPETEQQIAEANAQLREDIRVRLAGVREALIESAIKKATVRKRGRPRTQNRDAVAALRMYWLDRKPMSQIVLETWGSCKDRGCAYYCRACDDVWRKTRRKRAKRRPDLECPECHFRRRWPEEKGPEPVCFKCSDRMANLVRRLEAFLEENEIAHPPHPDTGQLREK